MPDRLAELVRQRALIDEHLAWLNRQIVDAAQKSLAEKAASAAPAALPPTPPSAPPHASHAPASETSHSLPLRAEADDILAQYRVPSTTVTENVRKGCFLYFVAAFVLLGLGVATLYWVFRPQ